MEKKEKIEEQEEDEYKDYTFIEKPAVLDKYKGASKITNAALEKCIELCKPGADIHKIC